MSQLSGSKWLLVVIGLVMTLGAGAATPAAAGITTVLPVSFTTINEYMVVVPVLVNGSGPYRFLLDTGTSRSVVDRQMADQLALPRIGQGSAVCVEENVAVTLVRSESVSMGAATVRNLSLTVLPKGAGLPAEVRGILGEDFLENFDVLIDNRHHRIELQAGPGTLADGLAGERLPVRLDGVMDGSPTVGRLIVTGRAPELSGKDITLLLDSGVSSLVMFGGPGSLGVGATPQNYTIASTTKSSIALGVSTKTVRQLRMGAKVVSNVVAVAPPARPGTDTDGLLPTALFQSIFISHSQRFVIFDPSTKR
jgi:predicted aspartyl protease